jgi:receptor protein-tyrosine kinase
MTQHGKLGASIVERAAERLTAEKAVRRPAAVVRPADIETAPVPEPAAENRPAVEPPPQQPQNKPMVAGHHVSIDTKRLPRAGVFSPEFAANRTTEEFRLVKQSVLQRVDAIAGQGRRGANFIMVTSARQGEGKSFVSANLAMSIAAEKDKSVLLIDADAARSSVRKLFGIDTEKGMLDALEQPSTGPGDVILSTNIAGLHVIPAGTARPLSAELYASERMEEFLNQIAEDFPSFIVIFDAPPVLATGEPSALARHMGQILLVVESEKTSQTAISEAINLVNICSNIGFVFNKAKFRFGAERFGKSYGYYYKHNAKKKP